MQSRSDSIDEFLARSGFKGAKRSVLAADASFRRYERVTAGENRFVLMDAPPDKEDIRPFIHIGEHLVHSGLSAPRIHARDLQQGLLLLEDLGDDLYSRLLRRSPEEEKAIYLAANDVLLALYAQGKKADFSDFPSYDLALLMREVNLFSQWFLPGVMGAEKAGRHAPEYYDLWLRLLEELPALRPVLVLRDYHADNLLWLPEREKVRRVGLLDFQDGVIGSPAYDMVSFLEDARRDVAPATVNLVLDAYLAATGIPKDDFMTAYALLGAQRNCKIIGIFARLAARDGKRQYLSLLPRVWGHLERDMAHPLLAPLQHFMNEVVRPEWRGVIDLRVADVQASA